MWRSQINKRKKCIRRVFTEGFEPFAHAFYPRYTSDSPCSSRIYLFSNVNLNHGVGFVVQQYWKRLTEHLGMWSLVSNSVSVFSPSVLMTDKSLSSGYLRCYSTGWHVNRLILRNAIQCPRWRLCPGGRWACVRRPSPCACSQIWHEGYPTGSEGSWEPLPWPGCSHPFWLWTRLQAGRTPEDVLENKFNEEIQGEQNINNIHTKSFPLCSD